MEVFPSGCSAFGPSGWCQAFWSLFHVCPKKKPILARICTEWENNFTERDGLKKMVWFIKKTQQEFVSSFEISRLEICITAKLPP